MSSSYGQLLKDLQVGIEEGEYPVRDFLLSEFGMETKNVGKDKVGWDIEIVGLNKEVRDGIKDGKTVASVEKKFINKYGKTFEIKRDKTSDRTGNFFYEVWSNIKVHNPGCVAASKAEVLVIVRKNEFIFINRGYFISWIIYNLYLDTPMSKRWKRKTCGKVKEVELKNSPISPQVRGILIPVEDIKKESCISVFKR